MIDDTRFEIAKLCMTLFVLLMVILLGTWWVCSSPTDSKKGTKKPITTQSTISQIPQEHIHIWKPWSHSYVRDSHVYQVHDCSTCGLAEERIVKVIPKED